MIQVTELDGQLVSRTGGGACVDWVAVGLVRRSGSLTRSPRHAARAPSFTHRRNPIPFCPRPDDRAPTSHARSTPHRPSFGSGFYTARDHSLQDTQPCTWAHQPHKMTAPVCDKILVVSGLGNAQGTGAACARLFSTQLGYKVALISRPRQEVDDLSDEINRTGGCVSGPAITNPAPGRPKRRNCGETRRLDLSVC